MTYRPTNIVAMPSSAEQDCRIVDQAAALGPDVLERLREQHYPVNYIDRQKCCVSCSDDDGRPAIWPSGLDRLLHPQQDPRPNHEETRP